MSKNLLIAVLFLFLFLINNHLSRALLKDEKVTKEQLVDLVNKFNEFFNQHFPKSNKIELRVKNNNEVGVFAKTNIQVK